MQASRRLLETKIIGEEDKEMFTPNNASRGYRKWKCSECKCLFTFGLYNSNRQQLE